MRKIYILLVALTMVVAQAYAQTDGYFRLKNVGTGHVANLVGGHTVAPNVTLDEALSLPGTVARVGFQDNKVASMNAQGVDVVNELVPTIKTLIPQYIDEEYYYAMRDSMVAMVRQSMSGAMGLLLVGYMNRYTYDNFLEWVNSIDTNMYYKEAEGGYYLFFKSPPFPIDAGDFTDYFVTKINGYLSFYRGTMQYMATQYLVGREELLPMVYSYISHFRFNDYFYLTEQTAEGYEKQFGFANSLNYQDAGVQDVWNILPVDNENYLGLKGQVQNAEGKWYTSFAADFPVRLSDGMTAYYVTDVVDAGKSQIKRVKVTDEVIPPLTPIIVELNGESPALNKLTLLDENYSYVFEDNALMLALDKHGYLMGTTLETPDPHYYALGISGGKVSLVQTEQTFLKPNEAYFYLDDSRKDLNTSGYLVLSDDVDGISETMSVQQDDKAVYDLQGRRMGAVLHKGIYVRNGKKFVVR